MLHVHGIYFLISFNESVCGGLRKGRKKSEEKEFKDVKRAAACPRFGKLAFNYTQGDSEIERVYILTRDRETKK